MFGPNFWRSRIAAAATLITVTLFSGAAAAQKVVMEPNGFPVPQPANPPEVACCVTGRGYPASAAELSGLFTYRGENINWERDAKTGPGVFSPLCGFSGTLVLRGGACKLDFGWYNVTQSGAPADNQIYTLIPNNDPEVYGAPGTNVDFCPLAGMTTNPGEQNKCQLKAFNAQNIRSDPRYTGGLVGFALRGNPSGSLCPETHFSQNELHASCTNCTPAAPWIMALIYESTVSPDSFYVAFEDQKAGDFGPGRPNDGDFNDFVFFISGVTCEGGGQPCDASATNPALKGACALGRTGCTPAGGGAPACNPVLKPSAERCDNLDNDCDGVVDNGNELCAVGQVCDAGTCVSACNTGEFKCRIGLECSTTGYCVDPACKDVMCQAGQVCRGGTCTGGCGGDVKCPFGQECQIGRCVDLCAGVTCEANQICEKGLCISSCSCRGCAEGSACAANGKCVDTACKDVTCPAGQYCMGGTCQDACAGAVCPGGAACMNGQCGDPLPGDMTGTGGGGNGPPIGTGGGITIGGPGGAPGTGAGTGTPGGPGSREAAESGCACRTAASGSGPRGLLAMGLLGVAAFALRRSRRRAA